MGKQAKFSSRKHQPTGGIHGKRFRSQFSRSVVEVVDHGQRIIIPPANDGEQPLVVILLFLILPLLVFCPRFFGRHRNGDWNVHCQELTSDHSLVSKCALTPFTWFCDPTLLDVSTILRLQDGVLHTRCIDDISYNDKQIQSQEHHPDVLRCISTQTTEGNRDIFAWNRV